MSRGPIVTLDGPSGSGKSTLARLLARRLGYRYVDTGAMYRAVGWLARREGVPFADGPELRGLLARARLVLEPHPEEPRVRINGVDVTRAIRGPEMGMVASRISALAPVREWLLERQRDLARPGRAVLEGRDTGTVVFPDADAKFFVTASLEERGRRRAADLAAAGDRVDPAEVTRDLERRDRNDSGRALAPLRRAQDAVEIDTTGLTPDQALEEILAVLRGRGLVRGEE